MKKKIIIAIVVLVILAAIITTAVVVYRNNYVGFEAYYDINTGMVTMRYLGYKPIKCQIVYSDYKSEIMEFDRMTEHTFNLPQSSVSGGENVSFFYLEEVTDRGSTPTLFRVDVFKNGKIEFIKP